MQEEEQRAGESLTSKRRGLDVRAPLRKQLSKVSRFYYFEKIPSNISQAENEKLYQTQRADALVTKRLVDKSYIKNLESELAAAQVNFESLKQYGASILEQERQALREKFEAAVETEAKKRADIWRGKQAKILEVDDMSDEDVADMKEVEEVSNFLRLSKTVGEADRVKKLVSKNSEHERNHTHQSIE